MGLFAYETRGLHCIYYIMLDTADFLFQTVPINLRVFLLCFNIEQTTVDRISTEMTFQRKLIVFSLLV